MKYRLCLRQGFKAADGAQKSGRQEKLRNLNILSRFGKIHPVRNVEAEFVIGLPSLDERRYIAEELRIPSAKVRVLFQAALVDCIRNPIEHALIRALRLVTFIKRAGGHNQSINSSLHPRVWPCLYLVAGRG